MLGRLAQWLTTKLEDKGDEHLRLRFEALTRLKKAMLDVAQVATEEPSSAAAAAPSGSTTPTKPKRSLTEDDLAVHELCSALEQCLKLGLRRLDNRDVTWWNVLYSSTLVVDEPTLVQGVQTAATLSETDDGKARCWMKLALNNHTLETSLMIIFSMTCEQVVRSSYEEWSLVRCDEGLEIFLQMIMDLLELRFSIHVDDVPFKSATPKEIPAIPIQTSEATESVKPDSAPSTTPSLTPPVSASSPMPPTSPCAADVSVCAEKLSQPIEGCVQVLDDEFGEVSAVVFPHRHKGIKPWQHVFGVSLAYLSKNPYHSRFALIDPVLAIPNIVQDCIDILYENPKTPRLFRTTVLNVTVSQLREIVETEGSLPSDLDAHGAGALILDFFKNLPDPLLTSEKYEAFVACGRIREEDACIRNIACLIQDLPVYCKYVLEKIIGVMHFLQLPENAEHNGVDVMVASSMLAPVIAFKTEATTTQAGQRKMSHTQLHDVRFAAVGAQVVEIMIQHHETIFQDVRIQVSDALSRLEAKKEALLSIYQLYKMRPQVNFLSDRQHLDEISDVFVESVKSREPSTQSPPNNPERIPPPVARKMLSPLKHRASSPMLYEGSLSENTTTQAFPNAPTFASAGNPRTSSGGSIGNRRQTVSATPLNNIAEDIDRRITDSWQQHGFNRPSILGNFDKGGVLLLRCVSYIVKQDHTLLDRLYQRALPTVQSSYDAGLVSSAICKSLIHLLKLVPAPEHPNINVVALSVEPYWELFDEEQYFQKLFHLMFQIFDQIWNSLSADEASFTRVFCDTEAKVDELLRRSPTSIEDMRNEWEDMWRQLNDDDDGSTEEENSTSTSALPAAPSPPRLSKKPSFTFKPEDYKNKLLGPSGILTVEHIAYIDHAVPMTSQLCRWCLLYSTETHGSSMHSLLMLVKNHSPTLLVVKDDEGNVFGGYGSDAWHRSTQYFGNGETFLFTFCPRAGAATTGSSGSSGITFTKYPWSRRNNYFMLCSEESLVMGGGGHFGLYLDSDLSRGSTGPCETFSSRPLVPSQEFNCVHVEVWGFTTSDKNPAISSERKRRSVLD